MNVKELLSFKPELTPGRESSSSSAPQRSGGGQDRSRRRLAVSSKDEAGILKKPLLSLAAPDSTTKDSAPASSSGRGGGGAGDLPGNDISIGMEISDEERLRILQMVEEEPEVNGIDLRLAISDIVF